MARSTCDGSKEPYVQALPLDAHIPSKSKDNNIDSPSINSKDIFTLPGSLWLIGPFSLVYGIFNNSSIK